LTKNYVLIPALTLGTALMALAQSAPSPQSKVGIISFQNAIVSTKDGQKAAGELQAKFAPKKAELDKKQSAIAQLQDQLRKGSNTLSEEAKQKLMHDIDTTTKSLNRETEDAQAELDQAQTSIMRELGNKMIVVIDKYAKENGFSLILDVSSPQTPVLYAANSVDITQDIIGLYDKANTGAVSSTVPPAQNPAAAKPAPPAPKK
jgi:outer membrane protein